MRGKGKGRGGEMEGGGWVAWGSIASCHAVRLLPPLAGAFAVNYVDSVDM